MFVIFVVVFIFGCTDLFCMPVYAEEMGLKVQLVWWLSLLQLVSLVLLPQALRKQRA